MTVRADNLKRHGVRGDRDEKGRGFATNIRGKYPRMVVRDVSANLTPLHANAEPGDIVNAVNHLIETINGPVSREIYEIGRYINERGEYVGP